ncbi:MAG: YggS family pyridoxal phosphate-dependent enzyme [Candidatus Wallbacteria bacterium]|nr:YggS family pyridoxal phosphate-dependent enzyme [Candidatus Wallbacteria bacterium]
MSPGNRFVKIRSELSPEVGIVVAVKTRSSEEIREVIDAGASDVGENYVQEAEKARSTLGDRNLSVRWHLIGPLQKNKINKALSLFDVIQTVDSLAIATSLDLRALRSGVTIPVMMEINSGREQAKSGFMPDQNELLKAVSAVAGMQGLRLTGLMTMGPFCANPEDLRPLFRRTRELFETAREALQQDFFNTLSMGMSDSYRIAVEEGSNQVRLGTVIFGAR